MIEEKPKYCSLCLEDSKGERRTELKWLGDVHVCLLCDLLDWRFA